MANNYTAVPDAYLEECDILTDAEFGRLVRALMRYHMTGEAIEPEGNERFFARRFMLQEDRHAEKYAELEERRRDAGRKGAAARWQPIANDGKNDCKGTGTDTDTGTDTGTG